MSEPYVLPSRAWLPKPCAITPGGSTRNVVHGPCALSLASISPSQFQGFSVRPALCKSICSHESKRSCCALVDGHQQPAPHKTQRATVVQNALRRSSSGIFGQQSIGLSLANNLRPSVRRPLIKVSVEPVLSMWQPSATNVLLRGIARQDFQTVRIEEQLFFPKT